MFSKTEISIFFPISGMTVYPGGIMVNRHCVVELWGKNHLHERGKIVKISSRSLNRLALIVRSSNVQFLSLMTLTYGANYPLSGKVAKRHLNSFLTDCRRKFGKFDYFWVIEFQSRGAIHFHIATTLPEPTYSQREIFADMWARISTPENWSYCPLYQPDKLRIIIDVLQTRTAVWSVAIHPKSWEAVLEQDGMSRYLAKYANKLRQKEVPDSFQNVGRFWGVSRGVSLPQGEMFLGTEAEVRQVLWLRGRSVEKWEILPKTVLC
jgi:hypothetical protein